MKRKIGNWVLEERDKDIRCIGGDEESDITFEKGSQEFAKFSKWLVKAHA